jgi:hypothetical protein
MIRAHLTAVLLGAAGLAPVPHVGLAPEPPASLAPAAQDTTQYEFVPPVPGVVARTEHFVLEDADGATSGFAVWRRRESERGVQLERELVFRIEGEPGPDPALFHVECLERAGSRLVLRETGAPGRALLAELVATHGAPSLRAWEWGPCAARQEVLALDVTAALPLYLAELVRNGRFSAGRVGLFDPGERAVVEITVETAYATDGAGARTTTWRRADGTLVLELEHRGRDLLAFRLQDGGPRARLISAETYARLRGSPPDAESAAR